MTRVLARVDTSCCQCLPNFIDESLPHKKSAPGVSEKWPAIVASPDHIFQCRSNWTQSDLVQPKYIHTPLRNGSIFEALIMTSRNWGLITLSRQMSLYEKWVGGSYSESDGTAISPDLKNKCILLVLVPLPYLFHCPKNL